VSSGSSSPVCTNVCPRPAGFSWSPRLARPYNALTFRLSAIEPSPPVYGGPVMFGLVFESDRDTQATVAVRKHRGEYVAWNVSCK
jgi:hypothetical protein